MTYKELLNLYKSGELSEEQTQQIEMEIEKQEAISEYLFDNEHIPEFSEMDIHREKSDDKNLTMDKNFAKQIKKAIRRAFIKAEVVVAAAVLVLMVLINITLPYIVDSMYYNPVETVGEAQGNETNRITLDTAVYTELFTPGYYRIKVNATREGNGEYDIHIPQNFSVNSQFRDVYGTVEKGKVTLYSGGLFKAVTDNAFVSHEIYGVARGYSGEGAAGDKETMLRKLTELDETDYYVGYVTFNKVMSYTELVEWSKKTGITPDWCAVCRQQEETGYSAYVANRIIGFNYIGSGAYMGYDTEKYPYLNYCDLIDTVEDFPDEAVSEENMETHFKSLLSYVRDNKDFGEMVGLGISDFEVAMYISSIEEYGLNIYGFAVVAQRDTLLRIIENEDVQYIYAAPLN